MLRSPPRTSKSRSEKATFDAMLPWRENRPFGIAGGTGGINKGGNIVRLCRSRHGIELRIPFPWTITHQCGHRNRLGGLVGIHDRNSFQAGLLADGTHLRQLFGGGDKDGASPRIAQDVSRLFPG